MLSKPARKEMNEGVSLGRCRVRLIWEVIFTIFVQIFCLPLSSINGAMFVLDCSVESGRI